MNIVNPYKQVYFLKSASQLKECPLDEGIEVAFAGRSNAGKSSALNYLTGIKQLARTSKTPGRTQLINFFNLDEMRRLVDLPGYGYAKVSQQTKAKWEINLTKYLEKRKSLKGLILLMDSRHPLKELDQYLIDWGMKRELYVHILLTKADKLSRGEAKSVLNKVRAHYSLLDSFITVQSFSVLKKEGIEELIAKLNEWFFSPTESEIDLQDSLE